KSEKPGRTVHHRIAWTHTKQQGLQRLNDEIGHRHGCNNAADRKEDALRRNMPRMLRRSAPKAMRTPTSSIRVDTADESRPCIPIAASENARIVNIPNTRSCTRRGAVCAVMTSSNDCTLEIA